MPIVIGVADNATEISTPEQPSTVILGLNPLLYYQFSGAAGPVPNLGSFGANDLATTDVTFEEPPIADNTSATSAGFNGTSSRGQAPEPVINGTCPTFSCGIWLRSTNTASTYKALVHQRGATGGGFQLRYYPGLDQVNCISFTGTGAQDTAFFGSDQFPSIRTGDLVLIGLTMGPTNAYLYVNGILAATSSRLNVSQPWNVTGDFWIGSDHVLTATDFFDGDISDVFVTETLITQDDWSVLYEIGRSPVRPDYDNLTDAFEFDPTVETNEVFSTVNASAEPTEIETLFPSGTKLVRSLWAKCTPSSTLDLVVSSSAPLSTDTHNIYVYSGTTLSDLVYVDKTAVNDLGNITNKQITLTGGTTYFFRIAANRDIEADVTVNFAPPPEPPANDDWIDAIEIDTTTADSVTGTTIAATNEVGEPASSLDTITTEVERTVWYKFTADATGTIVFTNAASDALIGSWDVYTGTAVNDLTLVEACVMASDTPQWDSTTTVEVTNGITYYIQVAAVKVEGVSIVESDFAFQWTDIT